MSCSCAAAELGAGNPFVIFHKNKQKFDKNFVNFTSEISLDKTEIL